ncbi:MAG: SIR2 family protein [Solirubrobacterales bacterium]
MEIPPDLKSSYAEGRLIPFVGAGVSASVRWKVDEKEFRPPNWPELVNQAAKILEFEDADLLRVRGTDLQILEFLARKGKKDELLNWLFTQLDAPDEALLLSAIHVKLAALEGCPVIYTTNYDSFIERSISLAGGRCQRLVQEADFPEVLSARRHYPSMREVVKFHGDINAREKMVLSETDYLKRLKLATEMDLRIRSDLLGRQVLFIGYSFNDPNVSYLFDLVQETFGAVPGSNHGRRGFIALPDPSEFERVLFQARNFDIIDLDSSDLTAQTAELLASLE